jgi:hypothetical protein
VRRVRAGAGAAQGRGAMGLSGATARRARGGALSLLRERGGQHPEVKRDARAVGGVGDGKVRAAVAVEADGLTAARLDRPEVGEPRRALDPQRVGAPHVRERHPAAGPAHARTRV